MNWFNIIKNPKLRAGSKVTTNLGSTSDNQPDNTQLLLNLVRKNY